MSNISATALRCEYKYDPLGIDIRQPRLSWRCSGEGRDLVQSAYQIAVAESAAALEDGPFLWDTGKVASDISIHHVYDGAQLKARQQYFWRVRISDGADQPSPWSKTARWEMGLMQTSALQARWIGVPWEEDTSRAQQHNIVWGQKGNFLDVPTDCPQRDERLGWTGDAQVFSRTACFNFDVASFYTKWLGDLAADQREDGRVSHVVPDILHNHGERGAGSAVWADAAVIVPWTMYQCYGDTRILEQQFDSMVKWVEFMRRSGDDEFIHNVGFHYGDWLALDQKDGNGNIGLTDTDLIATAFYAYSTSLLAQAAGVIGRGREVAEYSELAANICTAFQREFVTASGRLASNTQTAYVLALMFDLLSEEQRGEAARRLVADIRRHGTQLTTGFVGASYLCPVLTKCGYIDVAYELLLRQEYPSWLYPVTMGATTIWERWDGIRPDGSFQDPGMNSFNHYAYGAIGDWLYRVVAGLNTDPTAPGYRRAVVRPRLGGGLSWAYAALATVIGEYSTGWSQRDGHVRVAVTVPANGHAEVHLPNMQLAHVFESDIPIAEAPGCRNARQAGDDVVVEIGSGDYRFEHIPS